MVSPSCGQAQVLGLIGKTLIDERVSWGLFMSFPRGVAFWLRWKMANMTQKLFVVHIVCSVPYYVYIYIHYIALHCSAVQYSAVQYITLHYITYIHVFLHMMCLGCCSTTDWWNDFENLRGFLDHLLTVWLWMGQIYKWLHTTLHPALHPDTKSILCSPPEHSCAKWTQSG